DPFGFGHGDLDAVIEVEESAGARAIPYEGVKGRQQRRRDPGWTPGLDAGRHVARCVPRLHGDWYEFACVDEVSDEWLGRLRLDHVVAGDVSQCANAAGPGCLHQQRTLRVLDARRRDR